MIITRLRNSVLTIPVIPYYRWMKVSPVSTSPRIYRLYGRTLRSTYPVATPEKPGPLSVPVDIEVYFDGFEERETTDPFSSSHPPDAIGRVWKILPNGYRMLRYYSETGFMVQYLIREDGREIRMSQSWPEWRDSLFGLMNPAMAAAVVLGGTPVLHGSSLVYNGKSFLLMGVSGVGKSTLSTALAVAGMMSHSDDIGVPGDLGKDGPVLIQSGYGQIKVTPDLPARVGLPDVKLQPIYVTDYFEAEPEATRAIDTGTPKVSSDNPDDTDSPVTGVEEMWLPADALPAGFYPDAAPLAGIVVLAGREHGIADPKIEPLHGMQAVMALTEHMYGRDWLQRPSSNDVMLFQRLAGCAPVWRVRMPDNIDYLMNSARKLLKSCIEPSAH